MTLAFTLILYNSGNRSKLQFSKVMVKQLTSLIVLVFITCIAYAQPQAERWECALNLHQGDTGTLSLERADDSVSGTIRIVRNDSNFDSEVSGRWVGDRIDLNRLVDSSTSEPMAAIATRIGTQQVKIGGRFAVNFHGIWSADCSLATTQSEQKEETMTNENGKETVKDVSEEPEVPPSISSRVSPNNPTDRDRIEFSALANHPDGVQSISFYLADKKIHNCSSGSCTFTHTPLVAGNYEWRVEALSSKGSKSSESIDELVVLDTKSVGSCTISGSADGFSSAQSPLFFVSLFGPDNSNLLRSTVGFKDMIYRFENLPAGDYLLSADTSADESVLASPSSIALTCYRDSNISQNFNFH